MSTIDPNAPWTAQGTVNSGPDNTTSPTDVSSLWGTGISSTDVSMPLDLGDQTNPWIAASSMNSPLGKTTVGQALRDFYSMNTSQLISLQQELYNSGLWTSSKPPVLGDATDTGTYDAYKNAVIQAARSGMTLADVISNADAAGANRQGPAPRTLGLGKYVISLTNPADVLKVADAAATALLGRRATQQEVSDVAGGLRSQELAVGQAEYQQYLGQNLPYYEQIHGGAVTSAGSNPATAGASTGTSGVSAADATAAGAGYLDNPPPGTQVITTADGTRIVVPQQLVKENAPTADAAAYQYYNQNDASEVTGRTVAGAMQAIADFIGKK